jgi:integrase
MATTLTDRFLKTHKLPKGAKDQLVFDAQCPGLVAPFTAAGNVRFLCQWHDRASQKKRREVIGTWGAITLPKARELAQTLLGRVAAGFDPVAEREKAKAEADAQQATEALTLEKLISTWADLHLSQRRAGYRQEAQRALRTAFKAHLRKPAARLSRADVIAVLDGLVQSGRGTAAGRTMAYGRAMYAWAHKRETVLGNPFHRLPIAATTSERDRVLTRAELADIRAAAESLPYPWGPFYLTALYTLQRREEVAGMQRTELAADLSQWAIGADRMKNNRQHIVHLSPPARAVLQTIPPITGRHLVFSSNGKRPISGFSKAKKLLDARIAAIREERAAQTGSDPEQWRAGGYMISAARA